MYFSFFKVSTVFYLWAFVKIFSFESHWCFCWCLRFSLILSKTKKLEVDMTGISFEKIDDIHCHVLCQLLCPPGTVSSLISLYLVLFTACSDLFASSNCRIKTIMMFWIRMGNHVYIQMALVTSLRTLLGCVQLMYIKGNVSGAIMFKPLLKTRYVY